MNINELKSFRLSDAVHFHDELNPALWSDEELIPEVREQLLSIAQDFMEHLGVSDLDIVDITLSGSNAAYTYTKHSDIDLHLIADIEKLENDEIYRELFTAKKTVFNDSHDIKIHGYDVELYVQMSNEPVKSLGEYSVLKDRWIRRPSARRSALDQTSTKHKFTKLVQLCELALRSDDVDAVQRLLDTIKKYRGAGLEFGGEFGPENLVFKSLRSRGIIDKLYAHRDKLHSAALSLDEEMIDDVGFDNPWDLKGGTQRCLAVTSMIRSQGIKGLIQVWERADEPSELLATFEHAGAWEVHHIHWDEQGKLHSGKKLRQNKAPNIGMIATAKKIYEDHLARGRNVRVSSPPELWRNYSTLINRIVSQSKGNYEVGSVNKNATSADGEPCVSQIISHRGKMLNGKKLPESMPGNRSTPSVEAIAHKHDVPVEEIEAQLRAGIKVELEHTSDRATAREIALDHLNERPDYYSVLSRVGLEEASGYIPSEAERDDPRFKTALTVDVTPNSIADNVRKLGLGPVKRAGVPQTMRGSGKFKR